MASKIMEKAPSWVVRVLLPEINEMKGELRAINVKNDSPKEELLSKIESLRNEMMSIRNELKTEIGKVDSSVKDLDKRLDIVQRLVILEAKQRKFEKKNP